MHTFFLTVITGHTEWNNCKCTCIRLTLLHARTRRRGDQGRCQGRQGRRRGTRQEQPRDEQPMHPWKCQCGMPSTPIGTQYCQYIVLCQGCSLGGSHGRLRAFERFRVRQWQLQQHGCNGNEYGACSIVATRRGWFHRFLIVNAGSKCNGHSVPTGIAQRVRCHVQLFQGGNVHGGLFTKFTNRRTLPDQRHQTTDNFIRINQLKANG